MFKEINIEQLNENIFDMIKTKWPIITAQGQDKVNAMTATWMQFGQLFNKNVATIYVRPQRYTLTCLNEQDYFSIAIFDETHIENLKYLGKISGFNEDKLKHCNYTTTNTNTAPYINEANTIFICKKIYLDKLKPENFLSDDTKNYPNNDYHDVIVAEIVKVLVKI